MILRRALLKKGLNAFAKSIDSCQPAQSAQADMKRNFSLPRNSLRFETDNSTP